MPSRPRARAWALALAALIVLPTVTVFAGAAPARPPGTALAEIEPVVLARLAGEKEATYWVVMRAAADLGPASGIKDWDQRGAFVAKRLAATARASQAGVRNYLEARGVVYRSFSIANTLKVTSTKPIMEALAHRSDVRKIVADRVYRIPEPKPVTDDASIAALEWGISAIRADDVWADFGVRGEGIVVANVDTGVQFDHPALVDQYRGNLGAAGFSHDYNWFDPSGACGSGDAEPCDNVGHGTHTMGTMVGSDGVPDGNEIGVAPGARWIAAKGCESFFCTTESLLAAGEWILEPTKRDGSDPDASMRPHIVNNSWGGPPGDDFYQEIVDGWVAAGIFPVFSAGNNGPGCRSTGSPGDYPGSYAVGAFDEAGKIAWFSSRGPSALQSEVKPEIAAPGVEVRSSIPGDAYDIFSGTSMAAPHVAGSIALAWSAAPSLVGDIDATRTLLNDTAIDTSDLQCGGTADDNSVWGEGRLDAWAAVDASSPVPTGTLSGTITDSATSDPIQGTKVVAVGSGTTRTAFTDADGNYELTLHVGSYTVTASAFGYEAQTASGVAISADTTTDLDFALVLAPAYAVSGVVSDEDGDPIEGATVTLVGTPIPAETTDAAGAYGFADVPVGEYTLTAKADGCKEIKTLELTVDGAETVDMTLGPKTDARGHTCSHVSAAYTEATTPLKLTGDDSTTEIELPFPFTLYGESYSSGFVSTNGVISFEEPAAQHSNGSIPSEVDPNAAIYAYWDDLYADNNTALYTASGGDTPERWFTVEWRGITFYDDSVRVDIEATLYEDGRVLLEYRHIDPSSARERGASATIGLENAAGTDAFQYSLNEAVLSDEQAILFQLPAAGFVEGVISDAVDGSPVNGVTVAALDAGVQVGSARTDTEGHYRMQLFVGDYTLRARKDDYRTATAAVTITQNVTTVVDFALAASRALVSPGDFSLVQRGDRATSRTFRLTNVGLRTLRFEVKEGNVFDFGGGGGDEGGGELTEGTTSSLAPEGYEPLAPPPSIHLGGPVLVFMDELPWGSTALLDLLDQYGIPYEVAGSPAMDVDLSVYEAVFISSDQPQEFYERYMDNLVNFEAYVAGGGFLWVSGAAWGWNGGDFTDGLLPGGARITGFSPAAQNNVVEPEHPLAQGLPDPFSGSDASHTTFADLPAGTTVITTDPDDEPTLIEYDLGDGRVIGSAQTLEFAVVFEEPARLILENGIPYAYAFESFTDVPWLSATPVEGTLGAGRSRTLTVSVDTGDLEPGLYRARVVLLTNDPQNKQLVIPVTVIVPAYQRRVNAGGPRFVDTGGYTWSGDRRWATGQWGYTNPAATSVTTTQPISATVDDGLYRSQRRDPWQYRFTVPNGVYEVRLGFAEISGLAANRRVFDVLLERELVLPAYDIAGEVGRLRADREAFNIAVTDGVLNVRLVGRGGYAPPVVNAITVTHRPDLELFE